MVGPLLPGEITPGLVGKADEDDADIGRAQMVDDQDKRSVGRDVLAAEHHQPAQ